MAEAGRRRLAQAVRVHRVLLVERSRILVESLAARLDREDDIRVVAATLSVAGAANLVRAGSVDVAVCAEELAPQLIAQVSDGDVPIVVLAESGHDDAAADLVQSGVTGWVTRDQSMDVLLATLRGVRHGETWIPPGLLTTVLRRITSGQRERQELEERLGGLTQREREILQLLGEGLDRDEVAARLHLSQHTVRTHLQNIRTSLSVHSTLAAVAVARAAGLGSANGHRAANGRPRWP